MIELFAGWRFALQRLRAGWRLMMVAAVGVLVAATLLAAVPIYAAAMTDLGLRFRLERSLSGTGDTFASLAVDRLLLSDPSDRARRDVLDAAATARLDWLRRDVLVEERTRRLDLVFVGHEAAAPPQPVTPSGSAVVRQPWGAFLFTLSDVDRHVDVVEGRLPGPSTAGAEVVLPDGFQKHARIGDVVRLNGPSFDDCVHVPPSQDMSVAADEVACRPSMTVSTNATATVVGFVRPKNASDARWQAFAGGWAVPDQPLVPRLAAGTPPGIAARAQAGEGSMTLLTTREQFFGAFAQRMPELTSRHRVGVVIDPATLGVRDVGHAIDALRAWQVDASERLALPAAPQLNALDVLGRFRNEQTFSQIPLLLILLQVVGIVLYYVVVVMATLLDRQAVELGVFRSRGASTRQLVGLHIVEAAVLAVPAAVVAPLLASRIVSLLGRTPGFHAITGGAALRAPVTSEAALLGIAGAVLAFLAILLPATLIARRGIVDAQRNEARPAQRGIVQRYYLDLAFVLLAAFLLWQLNQRGSVFDPGSVGGWSSDPLLLLSPLVITLAVALVVLRFYPPLIRVITSALLLLRGSTVVMGLSRASRSPAAYARLMLLLVMAVAVGTFATSYGPTVGRSLDERARYNTGADARVAIDRTDRLAEFEGVEAVRHLEGIADAALTYRGSLRASNGNGVALLSIDPQRAASMLWSRSDFAAQPLADLLRLLESDVPPGGGIALPDDARSLAINLRSANIGRALLQGRIRDARGEYWDAIIQMPERPGDNWVEATMPVNPDAPRPLTFVGFRVSDRVGQNLRADGTLRFDHFVAITPGGPKVIEDFEATFIWTIYGAPSRDETFKGVDTKDAIDGTRVAEWKWATSTSTGDRLLALADPAVPVSALMNAAAIAAFDTREGGVATSTIGGLAVPIVVRAKVDLFPTMDASKPFAIVSDAQLQSIAGVIEAKELRIPNELWLRFKEGTPLLAQQATLRALTASDAPLHATGVPVHRDAVLEEGGADPTLQVSGSGILTVAFGAVLGLSALGFAVTLALGARARAVEFAVLRAVGSSGRQILRGLVVEWGVVLVLGAVIGVLVGRQVARLMLRFLDVTDRGERVLPPFIVQTDWRTLAFGVGGLALVVLVTLTLAWLAAMRRAASAELRLTR